MMVTILFRLMMMTDDNDMITMTKMIVVMITMALVKMMILRMVTMTMMTLTSIPFLLEL